MKRKKGFTIVELLTVMAVIAVLIGLLVPALALVKDHAKRLQQKAQFHSIGVGLELYKSEFGSYPESDENTPVTPTLSSPGNPDETGGAYCGANKLAKAMVGLDFIGFPPKSEFRADAGIGNTVDVAYTTTSSDDRKGPYMELETANAFFMSDIYGASNTNYPGNFVDTLTYQPLVLCDVYAKKRVAKKAGTPILYYRARSNFKHQNYQVEWNAALGYAADDDDIYLVSDNIELLDLGMPDDGAPFTIMSDPFKIFEDMIRNTQVTAITKPYREDSFILISAGKDGDFGTGDDIFNFDKEIIE